MTINGRRLFVGAATGAIALVLTSGGTASAAPQPPAPVAAKTLSIGNPSVPYATWLGDVQAVASQADNYLRTRIPAGAPGANARLAIVLDIDNTSLESAYSHALPTPAVQAVLRLAQAAHNRGAKVFFVTARPDFIDWITQANLTQVGYPVDGLYGRSFLDLFQETSAFKTAKRAEIERNGYTIVANIGNNTSDLAGGHAQRTFKLPDYGGQLS